MPLCQQKLAVKSCSKFFLFFPSFSFIGNYLVKQNVIHQIIKNNFCFLCLSYLGIYIHIISERVTLHFTLILHYYYSDLSYYYFYLCLIGTKRSLDAILVTLGRGASMVNFPSLLNELHTESGSIPDGKV